MCAAHHGMIGAGTLKILSIMSKNVYVIYTFFDIILKKISFYAIVWMNTFKIIKIYILVKK